MEIVVAAVGFAAAGLLIYLVHTLLGGERHG